MTTLHTEKPATPTGRDYLIAALGFALLAGFLGAGWLLADAWGFHVSAEHEAIMHGARLMAGKIGR